MSIASNANADVPVHYSMPNVHDLLSLLDRIFMKPEDRRPVQE